MKHVLLCVLCALCSLGSSRVWAVTDPGERFLEAYFLILDGDAAERQADWAKANAKYNGALEILREIKSQTPDWNPHVIDFRLKYCNDHLQALQPKLEAAAPAAPPEPAPVEAETMVAPDRVQQLTRELQQAQDRIRLLQQERDALKTRLDTELAKPAPADREEAQKTLQQLRALQAANVAMEAKLKDAEVKAVQLESLTSQLQESRDKIRRLEAESAELNTKLQAALTATGTGETTPQIEELLRKNVDLTAQLAAARDEIARLREGTDAGQLQSELDRAKQERDAARSETEKLRHSQDEVLAQLDTMERQLRAAKASSEKDNEIIAELRKENALLREIVNRKGPGVRKPEETGGPTIPELKGWRPHRRQRPPPRTTPEPVEKESAVPTAMEESGPEKLVATIKSPGPTEASKPPAPPAPPAPVASVSAPPPSAPPPSPPPPARKPTPEVESASPEVRTLLNDAGAAASQKDFDVAAAKYDQVLAQDPKNVTALSNLAIVRYQQGQLDEAQSLLQQAVSAAPNDSPSRSLLGVVYFRKGQFEEAFSELTRAVALDPRNAEAHNYLGITLSEKGWPAAAEQEVRKAIELNPQYADAHFNLAALYARQRTPRLELARYHYEKAIDLGAAPDPQLEALLKPAPAATEQKEAEPATTP